MNLLGEILLYTGYLIGFSFKYMFLGIKKAIFPQRKDVSDDVVVITGGGSGLGQLMCIKFAGLGSTVVAWDINKAGLEATKSLVHEKTGREILTYVCDVSDSENVYDTARRTRDDVNKPITIFINNAGIVSGKLLLEMPDALIEKVFKVNTISHFWTSKAVLPEMMSKRKGHLVFIASSAGFFGSHRMTEYCSSKAADILLAESIEAELLNAGYPEIKVTTVCPWFINTGMFTGCECSLNNILPNLDPNETVDRIVDGVLKEETIIAMPWVVNLMRTLKCLMPAAMNYELNRKVGSHRMMDAFEGRAAKLD